MNAPSQRRARIARVRTLEHRLAAARHVGAQREAQALAAIARRLATLNAGVGVGSGVVLGQSLSAISELSTRLGKAEASLAAPIRQAETHRAATDANRIAAHRKEQSALRLADKATARERYERELRADADRPHRKRAPMGVGA